MKKIVVIGGGHGLAVIMRGLKTLDDVKLTAIVTVADDGGSTGRLRRQFHIPAMGDIRNVLISMAESETLLGNLMNYRFEDENDSEMDIKGHNLGNLILTALSQSCGNFMEAIQTISKVLNVKGDIVPSTTQVITLFAVMVDGTIVRGESNIPKFNNRIDHVYYNEEVIASAQAVKAIEEADYIIYGIGSLYTSIMPNLIIPGIKEALKKTKAKKIYISNAMSQSGETDHYTLEDHVNAIVKHSFPEAVDVVVTHNNEIYEETLEKYRNQGSFPICTCCEEHSYDIIKADILTFENQLVRHDSEKIRKVMEQIMNEG